MSIFRDERDGRLRAFWRLLFQYGIFRYTAIILNLLVFGTFAVLGGDLIQGSIPPYLALIGHVASLGAAVLSVWLACRFFDRRPFSDLGLKLRERAWWLDFVFGLLLGALLITGIFSIELSAGWISVTGTFASTGDTSFLFAILPPLVTFLCVGFYEELVFRGYELRNAAEGLNYPGLGPKRAILLAWAISSLFFGFLHLPNPNATLLSAANIAFAGLMLGSGYVLTGRLGLPVGLHIAWNFFQGNVFGFPVSGTRLSDATFVEVKQSGPALLTGGAFGPEGGLLVPAACVLGTLLILLWVRLRSGKATLHIPIAEPPTRKIEAL